MDKADFEKLIAECTPDMKGKGVLLYNGYVKSAAAYQAESTATNLKNWKAAEDALNDFVRDIKGRTSNAGKSFKNRRDVVAYLRDQGVSIGKSKLYQDSEVGKLRIQPDRSVLLSDVDIYVKAYLTPKQKAGDNADMDQLQKENMELVNRKLREQIERMEFDKEVERGKYIRMNDFEMEIATRAAVFEISLKQLTASKVYEWLAIGKGDTAMARDIAAVIDSEIDKLLNDYATTDRFHVIFEKAGFED